MLQHAHYKSLAKGLYIFLKLYINLNCEETSIYFKKINQKKQMFNSNLFQRKYFQFGLQLGRCK